MSESSELSHARQDVEAAFRVLEFAIRTMCYFELGKVDMSIFSQPLTLLLKEKNAGFRDSHFSSLDHAIIASQMNVGAAFGVSAIVLDNFFEVARGKRNPLSNEPEDLVWCLVYMVRNAFAHGMANPKWVIKGAYRRVITIDLEGTQLVLDFAALDGQDFSYSQIGGFANWEKIKQKALDLHPPE